ncbi:outer membrane beta-barrel protein [uncultured Paraglaciecola sp.]|uniref:outer membrane beta-barrel protein n=1 Tax=uncultured Paraglaciecola sp. TaxID=1765024 RepID=UPI002639A511|nr:outer membrane beta-barrel protein [uncultured Paraglaciecola sp.]
MHIRTSCGVSCWSLLLVSQSVLSQESFDNIRVVTGLSLGYSDFSFPEKLDHNISFPSANIPIALTTNNWQLSLNASSTLTDADIAEEEDIGKASRKDLDVTLGYRVDKNWSLFAGLKYGKTDMAFVPRDLDEEIEEDNELDLDEDDGPDEVDAPDIVELSNESYSQKGPFIGVSYSWRFEKAGSLSVSLAYASLEATNQFSANTDDDDEEDELPEFDDLSGRVKGDTKGFSYGLSWTMPLSSNLLFQTRFKINDYQQDIMVDGERFENIDETFTTLHIGLAYVF